ncbi:single-stranded-DNA-specific exonuclease [Clostridium sp. USBA 49]|uniref:single-stranded-DNA-specific exonuclease RecJ n=1 Tax=Clostridium TaxID=1485 RepID=UPI0009D3BDCD|nr:MULTISPECIES: single-stranded-DNA-specific exonuclease RecJ [Clostridium]SKA72772.1 single-stranded-DNA-specific exonuclease [Clostridium sp. USBA 49]
MEERWLLRRNNENIKEMIKSTGLNEIILSILFNRGINEENKIKKFMRASLDDLYDPFLMKDMDKATDIIKNAIINNKNIVIYGDYDVDGVTSTVILYKALKRCGALVNYYIPNREYEGYGINSERLSILKKEGAEIILTCDNGISAIEQIKYGKSLGLDIIITDHHEIPFIENKEGIKEYVVPEADAVINPKQEDCKYPFKLLCGASIAYKFSIALFSKMGISLEYTKEFIILAGIATICDVVDLVDENRIIAKNALKLIQSSNNIGLNALIEVLNLKDKKISASTIGFQIGPCINATGRLESAELSVELLLCKDKQKAQNLAIKLSELNKTRQYMTTKNVEDIIKKIENSDLKNDKVLVVYEESVHESIAGIVAGKVKEKFNVPTIILTKGREIPKGSGRSIEKYNLFEELLKCKELLDKFGGHPMAAGLSIKRENIEILREKLNKNCTLKDEDIIPKIRIDRRIPIKYITKNFIEELNSLEPFGKGNETPILAEKNLIVNKFYILGKEANVLKLNLTDLNKYNVEAISYGKVDKFKELLKIKYKDNYDYVINNYNYIDEKISIDIIFYPYINSYNGFENVQLKVSKFRLSS